jgi:hypothetical protein
MTAPSPHELNTAFAASRPESDGLLPSSLLPVNPSACWLACAAVPSGAGGLRAAPEGGAEGAALGGDAGRIIASQPRKTASYYNSHAVLSSAILRSTRRRPDDPRPCCLWQHAFVVHRNACDGIVAMIRLKNIRFRATRQL